MNPTWKDFLLTDIFIPVRGNQKNMAALTSGTIPLVSARKFDNGYKDFVSCDKKEIYDGNCITINNDGNGGAGLAYYQPSAMAVDTHVTVLMPKHKIDKCAMLFIVECLNKQADLFSHARSLSNDRIRVYRLMLPVDNNGKPNYIFMSKSTKKRLKELKRIGIEFIKAKLEKINYSVIDSLASKEWKAFFVTDIFPRKNIKRGKRLTKEKQTLGTTPYISSTAMNNGVDNFITIDKKMRLFNHCLSIANSGSVGSSFYEPFEYVASDHVTHLENKKFDEYIYLFIATMTSRWEEKYNFNREINDKRISREKVLLPINDNGDPDYEYMRQFIINIEYKQMQNYLDFMK